MSQRHFNQNNQTMLITSITHNRERFFLNPTCAREAIETLYRVQAFHPFFLYAFCIMPDHIHLLVHVPEPETISRIMNVWKSGVVSNIGISKLWQKRFHVQFVHEPEGARLYIHQNPVRAGLVDCAENYPWSSACGKWDVSSLDCTWSGW
jgi:REP element-mobilizing transposase RayT